MKRIELIIIIALTWVALTVVGQDYGKEINPDAGFKKKLKEYSAKTQSIEAEFSQVKTLSVLSSSINSKGFFYYVSGEGIAVQIGVEILEIRVPVHHLFGHGPQTPENR